MGQGFATRNRFPEASLPQPATDQDRSDAQPSDRMVSDSPGTDRRISANCCEILPFGMSFSNRRITRRLADGISPERYKQRALRYSMESDICRSFRAAHSHSADARSHKASFSKNIAADTCSDVRSSGFRSGTGKAGGVGIADPMWPALS